VKQIVSISLGKSQDDYEFVAEFMGQEFNIKRVGTDGEVDVAADLMGQWDSEADAIMRSAPAVPLKSRRKRLRR